MSTDTVASASEVLFHSPSLSIVRLTLAPGQQTTIHDHLAWCVVSVVEGTEHETRYVDRETHLEIAGQSENAAGTVSLLMPPGDIHRVANRQSRGDVVSLHIYGTDVTRTGSSVRRVYDQPVRPTSRPNQP